VRVQGSFSAGNTLPPARMENDACVAAKLMPAAVTLAGASSVSVLVR
jgi:hypothetical protein